MKASGTTKHNSLSDTLWVLSCLLAFSLLGNLLPRALSFEMAARVIGSSGSITYDSQAMISVGSNNPIAPSVPFKIDRSSYHPNGTPYLDGEWNWYSITSDVPHEIEMPDPWTNPSNDVTYYFSIWDDGVEDNPRTVILDAGSSQSFYAVYTTTPDGLPPPLPPPPSDSLYSFVHITDTQYLSEYYPDNLNAMFSYLESVRTEYNIKWISFSGDCVQNWGSTIEWDRFTYACSLTTIPIEICAGNHDNNWGTDFYWYNQYIGEDKQYYYTIHEDFICLYISWFGSGNTMDNVMIGYFQNAIADHPSKIPLIVTHYYMNVDGSLVSLAYQIHDSGLVQSPTSIVLCGHMHGSFSNTRTVDGTTVYEFMTNYQEQSGYACARFFTLYQDHFTERVLRIRPEPVDWVTEETSYSLS